MRLGGFRVEVMRPSAWGSRFRGLFAHVYAVFKVWDLARLLKGSWDLVARGFRVATLIVTYIPINEGTYNLTYKVP